MNEIPVEVYSFGPGQNQGETILHGTCTLKCRFALAPSDKDGCYSHSSDLITLATWVEVGGKWWHVSEKNRIGGIRIPHEIADSLFEPMYINPTDEDAKLMPEVEVFMSHRGWVRATLYGVVPGGRYIVKCGEAVMSLSQCRMANPKFKQQGA